VKITIAANGVINTMRVEKCFSVVFKNGVNRLVAPSHDDPARVIDTGGGRVVSATSPAVREELVRRYEAEPGEWQDVVLIEQVG